MFFYVNVFVTRPKISISQDELFGHVKSLVPAPNNKNIIFKVTAFQIHCMIANVIFYYIFENWQVFKTVAGFCAEFVVF